MKLFLFEKRDFGADIAKIQELTDCKTHFEGKINGQDVIFAWAAGHLVGIGMPEDYGIGWEAPLPIQPEFKLFPIKEKASYLHTIRPLLAKADVIVNACDPDREGSGIFYNIYHYLGCRQPIERLWLPSKAKDDVRAAFEGITTIKTVAADKNLGYAADGRGKADWLAGMNGSRALSQKANRKGLSVGRVKTATLAIVARRYLDYKNFKPTPYYVLQASIVKDNVPFNLLSEKISSQAAADNFLAEARQSGQLKIDEVKCTPVQEQPPLLFDLAGLQQAAIRQLGYTLEQVTNAAQSLYMAGVMTYPRTDSQFIGENDYKQLPALLDVVKGWGNEYATAVNKLPATLNKASVNDSKVTGHHALMPTKDATADKIQALSEVDKNVLVLVAKQTIMAVGEVCKKDSTTVKGQVLNVKRQEVANEFKATGSIITYAGWRGLFKEESGADEKEENAKFPALAEGEVLPIAAITRLNKQTEPPKLFTEATLIAYMKTCGKEVDDKQLREILKSVEGIGRPATRPGIIKELVEQNHYLAVEKKKVIPTELGLYVYEITKDMDIASVELTAKWEQQLDEVAEGTLSHRDFMAYSKAQVSSLISALQAKEIALPAPASNGTENAPKCPKCGRPTRAWAMGISCSGSSKDKDKQVCDFILWRKQLGKELTDTQLVSLLTKGHTGKIKGFVSKNTGKAYEAKLVFDKKEFKVVPKFD